MRYLINSEEKPTQSKKKKSNSKSNTSYPAAVDADEMAALNRRAQRFQREHELERMKSIRGGSSTQVNHTHSHLLNRINNNSRSASPSAWGSNNDGADQVRLLSECFKDGRLILIVVSQWTGTGIILSGHHNKCSRITSV